MKWIKWGLGATGALLAGGVLTFAVLAVGGTAQAEDGDGRGGRFQELLAQQLGISVEQLKTAETNARHQLADELVREGKITQAQADKIKSSNLGGFLRGAGPGPGMHAAKIAVNVAEITGNLSKISTETLRAELQQGKTFAQIAAEHGVSRDTLKSAILSAQKAALQGAVSRGEVTQAVADKMAQALAEHVDQLIDRSGPMKGMHHIGPMGAR